MRKLPDGGTKEKKSPGKFTKNFPGEGLRNYSN